MTRKGPGLLLQDIRGGADPQVAAVAAGAAALAADVLVLAGVDWDHDRVALDALAARLAAAGAGYPHRFALRPNSGMATGLDLDGDGRRGGPGDAQGWGRFAGAGGLAILSRLPVEAAAARDFSGFLWRDLPGGDPPPLPAAVLAVQRLSSVGHWEVPLRLPGGGRLWLMVFHATPPVFDGPEDRNGRRNADEIGFWRLRLSGALDAALGPVPPSPFVLLGTANLDPMDGEGRQGAVAALLSHPALQDPAPRGAHGRPQEPGQRGDPSLDTALFPGGPGGLRTELLLPAAGLKVAAAGVLWPPEGAPLADTLAAASRHRPVWADLILP